MADLCAAGTDDGGVREFPCKDSKLKDRSWRHIVVVDSMRFDCKPGAFAASDPSAAFAAFAPLAAYSSLGVNHPMMVEVGKPVHSAVVVV